MNAAKRSVSNECSLFDQDFLSQESEGPAAIEIADLVNAVLDEKPLAKKILLARMAGFDQKEIAQRVGRAERTVRRVLNSLKEKFASRFNISFDARREHDRSQRLKLQHATLDDIDLLRMVGVGQFGKVYLARDNRNGVKVAVKILKKSWLGNESSEKTLLNEIEKLRELEHPSIVSLVKAGVLPNGSLFVVIEFAEGMTLRQVLPEQPDITCIEDWLLGVLSAVEYLHEKGVVHGDLQPANVIVDGRAVKLIDFGFSAFVGNASSAFVGGTAGFIAPELEASCEADVFSLGKLISFVNDQLQNELSSAWLEIAQAATRLDPGSRPTAKAIQLILVESRV